MWDICVQSRVLLVMSQLERELYVNFPLSFVKLHLKLASKYGSSFNCLLNVQDSVSI